ncbi:MAG: hypothetical protein GW795_12880 [Cyanobacteria bacterium]|nr:hypothetical protein [Cyanobacteria bacterium CG_2015-04_32_10]
MTTIHQHHQLENNNMYRIRYNTFCTTNTESNKNNNEKPNNEISKEPSNKSSSYSNGNSKNKTTPNKNNEILYELKTKTEKTLSSEELYLLIQHDKKLDLLINNIVPTIEKNKFMYELLMICSNLSRHKNEIKGWEYLTKYFSDNIQVLSDDDFFDYMETFSIIRYDLKEETWLVAFNNFISRKWKKEQFLKLVDFFSCLQKESQQNKFLDDVIDKINNEDIEVTTNEYLIILINIALNIKTMPEKYWIEIKNFETIDFSTCNDSTIISLVNLSYKIKLSEFTDGKGENIYNAFREFFTNNIYDFSIFTLPYLFELYVFMNDITFDDIAKICILLGTSYKIFPTCIKVNFICALVEACYIHPTLKKTLIINKSLMPLLHIPSDEVIELYKKERAELDKLSNLNKKELILEKKKIVLGFIDKLGFNKYYIQNYDKHSSFAHNELSKFSKKYKKED